MQEKGKKIQENGRMQSMQSNMLSPVFADGSRARQHIATCNLLQSVSLFCNLSLVVGRSGHVVALLNPRMMRDEREHVQSLYIVSKCP